MSQITATWPDRFARLGQPLDGTCAFRLMPTDAFASGSAGGELTAYAGGFALTLTYAWIHPTDGPQDGILLVGSPEDDTGAVSATWLDSWHQKPGPLSLQGIIEGPIVRLAGVYYEVWGWQIDLDGSDSRGLRIVMRNVVPEGHGDFAGAYDVMDLRLTRP